MAPDALTPDDRARLRTEAETLAWPRVLALLDRLDALEGLVRSVATEFALVELVGHSDLTDAERVLLAEVCGA